MIEIKHSATADVNDIKSNQLFIKKKTGIIITITKTSILIICPGPKGLLLTYPISPPLLMSFTMTADLKTPKLFVSTLCVTTNDIRQKGKKGSCPKIEIKFFFWCKPDKVRDNRDNVDFIFQQF